MKSLSALVPLEEIAYRHTRCRAFLHTLVPEAEGMLIVSRLSIYYLTGTLGWGLLWLPLEGESVLLLRKGTERARMESPLSHIASFKSYKEVDGICRDCGSPLASVMAVDKNGFTWTAAEMLQSRLGTRRFLSADAVLARAKAVKSEWELERLRPAPCANAGRSLAFPHPSRDDGKGARSPVCGRFVFLRRKRTFAHERTR